MTYSKYVLVLQHHVAKQFIETVREVLGGASDGFINSFLELLFLLVADLNVLIVYIVSIHERKIPVCDHRACGRTQVDIIGR